MADEIIDGHPDRIGGLFDDKTVFITGGTGFMGKVLVEKLLRSCSGVKRIYLLVRPKKGKDPQERIREILNGPLFELLKEQRGTECLKKVKAIAGDVTEIGLGLSPEDRKTLTEETELIYHCAATIRFDEPLKRAVILNVRGTKFMLDLAKECTKLLRIIRRIGEMISTVTFSQKRLFIQYKVFAHLSTAYCHLNERILYEKAYPPPANPHHVIKCCEWMSEEIIDTITEKLLGDIPNTYAFTKALGEALVLEQVDTLPVIVLRPSVVIPIWKEPLPGWTDNINGPTGLLIGAGKGVIRTMFMKGEGYADYLPVDIAVNCLLCTSYDYVQFRSRRIYNLTSSSEYKVSFEEIIEIGRRIIKTRMPLNGVVWYPGGSMKRSRFVHNLAFFFFHLVPAVFIDALLIILGYKPVLWRVQKRISKGFEVFEYYANNQWDFQNETSLKARDLMNPTEKKKYKLDGDGINYEDYFTTCIHAARLYILNETDDTLPSARRHMKVMYCVDIISKILLTIGFFYLLYKHLFCPILGL